MKNQHLAWYALALGAAAVGAFVLGVSSSTILLALVVLVCPVMMLFMMGGHGGGSRPRVHRRCAAQ
ncbi:MAG: DUF2933 domain-containing protein [Mycolicibacterium rufum]|uniref:DUF2933 domain-containing protein n=2 Tax=Mycolicibacterium chlorophenolicum TaxID=37916 RepID=A0A0J6VP82_9MYCO|nr:hypothetical protein MCHLDSM_03855 [Mycolicibacterium chlorophenolicum]MBI5340880.1 DUF2933 domain-containing protein [Mycolicibacterium rufum]